MTNKTLFFIIYFLAVNFAVSWNAANSYAAIQSDSLLIKGTVETYNSTEVIIRTKSGGRARLPFKSLTKSSRQSLHVGGTARAIVSMAELKKWNFIK